MELEFEPPLDQGIKCAVELLSSAGVETYESCEGGEGHAYREPTVRFHGGRAEGLRALSVMLENALPVKTLRRIWEVIENEPVGPEWEVVFWCKLNQETIMRFRGFVIVEE